MNRCFLTGLLLFALALFASAADTRPNLVLIIADDMAWNDCGAYGHPTIKTPHLDQMAREGMRFDNAFLACSSCSPSRCSTITGRYPHATGARELHQPLPGDQVTFVELLKASGYFCGQAGKWHLGNETKPKFDDVREGGKPSGCEYWLPLLQERPKDKPFFLWLASSDPHRGYQEGAIPVPHRPDEVVVPPFLPDNEPTRADLALYYDEISRLDSYVGKVRAELEAQGVAENTLVLFISDNGRPFPRCKTTVLDSGVKTPFIAAWPGRVKAGSTCNYLVSTVDIAPTFVSLAGVERSKTFQGVDFTSLLDGVDKSVRKLVFSEHNWHDFDDHQRSVRSQTFRYVRNSYPDVPLTPPADAVRSPTYQSMIEMYQAGTLPEHLQRCFEAPKAEEELYDLTTDPFETRNLANSDDPEIQDELKKMRIALDKWRSQSKDFIPEERTPDGFDRITGERLKQNNRNSGRKK